MKKSATIVLFFLIAFGLTGFSTNQSTANPTVKFNKTIYLDGNIDGDVILFANEVTVNATISGDLIVFAGQADIQGSVRDNLRVVAGQVNLDAEINDDVSLVAGQIEINQNTKINHSFIAAASRVRFDGQANQDVTIVAGSVDIFPHTKIAGNLNLELGRAPVISSQAQISGKINQTLKPELSQSARLKKFMPHLKPTFKTITGLIILEKLAALTIEILIGWLLIVFLPQLSKQLVNLGLKQPGAAIGWGLLFLTTVPLLAFLFIITLIGIPLGVVAILIYIISLSLAKLLAAFSLGSQLLKDAKFQKPYFSLVIGLIIMTILQLIPIFGWLAYFILILFGLGILTLQGKTLLVHFKK
ncbi:MAG: polymer-forming cytoskeletal protein [Patescibacteria group bacterium]|nr:polymer-forming cytoskeletal protein [Patescibacteria group bacterium]